MDSMKGDRPPMRLIHTADWHLGHRLHEVDRRGEHEAFLDWLVDTIHEREADALLMSGDVFDTANPSAEAQELWYRFLARCRRSNPDVDIVVIGGNHRLCRKARRSESSSEGAGCSDRGRAPSTRSGCRHR